VWEESWKNSQIKYVINYRRYIWWMCVCGRGGENSARKINVFVIVNGNLYYNLTVTTFPFLIPFFLLFTMMSIPLSSWMLLDFPLFHSPTGRSFILRNTCLPFSRVSSFSCSQYHSVLRFSDDSFEAAHRSRPNDTLCLYSELFINACE